MKLIRGKRTGDINIIATLRNLKSELEQRKKEERQLRNDETYKTEVMKVLDNCQGINPTEEFLIGAVLRNVFHDGDSKATEERVTKHVRLNYKEGGYLQRDGYKVKLRD